MEQERSGKRNMSIDYRSMGELIRGLFFMLFGLFAIFAERLGMGSFQVSQTVLTIFGGGADRLWYFPRVPGSEKFIF